MKHISTLLFAMLWLLAMQQLRATSLYWTGAAGDNNWHTADNWNPSQLPSYLDDVYFTNPPYSGLLVEIKSGSAECNSMFITGNGYTFEIKKNTSLDVHGDLQLNAGNLITNQGNVSIDQNLLCYGHFDNYKEGYLLVSAKLTIFTGGLFENRGVGSNFSQVETYNLDNFGSLSNDKMATLQVSNQLNNYSDCTISDHASLTVDNYLNTTGDLTADKHAEIIVLSRMDIVGHVTIEDHSILTGDHNLLIRNYGNLSVLDHGEIFDVMELKNYQLITNESFIEVDDAWVYFKGTIQNNKLFNIIYTLENNGLIINQDQFMIGDQCTIDVQGEVNNSGCFEVFGDLQNAGSYIGTLLSHASVYGSGLYRYTRNTGGAGSIGNPEGWHFISSPVWGLDVSIMYDYFVNDWDENHNTYYHYSEGDIPCYPGPPNVLEVMKGYSVKRDLDYACNAINPGTGVDIEFEGTMNDVLSGAYSIDVSGTNFEAGDPHQMNNWNLVGNPYPSSIDASQINFPPEIDQAVYYYDDASLNYQYFVGGVGQPYIPVAQGFFIHVNTPGTFTFGLDNTVRTCSGSNLWYKTEITNLLTIRVSDGQKTDKTYIRLDDQASAAFHGKLDAYKMLSPVQEIPQLFSTIGTTKYAINSLKKASSVDLGFLPGNSKTYQLDAEGMNDFDCVYLEDKLTGAIIDLKTNPGYSFYSQGRNDQIKRFVLHFDKDFPGIIKDGFVVFSRMNYIYVNNMKNRPGTIRVFNILGQLEASFDLQQGLNTHLMNTVPGMYIVNLNSEGKSENAKVLLD